MKEFSCMYQQKVFFIFLSNDLLFKQIFGTQKNIRFLEVLLEEIKGLPRGSLHQKISVLNSYPLNKTNLKNKTLTSDILVELPDEIINLEMYTSFDQEKFTKSKMYFFRIYATELQIGKDYSQKKKVTQYNLCLKSSLPFTKNLKTEYLLKEENYIVDQDLKGFIYNLDKIKSDGYNVGESNLLEKMLLLIKAPSFEIQEKIAEGSEILMDLVKEIRKLIYDEDTRKMKNMQDKWREEARKEAREEAMAEGLKEGIEQGIEQKELNVITNMLENNESISKIAQYTGASIQKIMKIEKERSLAKE